MRLALCFDVHANQRALTGMAAETASTIGAHAHLDLAHARKGPHDDG